MMRQKCRFFYTFHSGFFFEEFSLHIFINLFFSSFSLTIIYFGPILHFVHISVYEFEREERC